MVGERVSCNLSPPTYSCPDRQQSREFFKLPFAHVFYASRRPVYHDPSCELINGAEDTLFRNAKKAERHCRASLASDWMQKVLRSRNSGSRELNLR